MKDWRFRYHENPQAMWVHRRVPPFPSHLFWPHTMSDWLRAKGDPRECSGQWQPRKTPRPLRSPSSLIGER